MKKRVLSLALALALCFSLMATGASAAAGDVYVGSVDVGAGGYWLNNGSGDITPTGASASNYNVHYNAATATLTLKDADISTYHYATMNAFIRSGADLKLVLIGSSTLDATDNVSNSGVYVDGSLTISGSGSLTVVGGNGSSGWDHGYGIFSSGALSLGSDFTGTINALGYGITYIYGIYANGINIESGTVYATANDGGREVTGICSMDTINISGGTVYATSGNAYNPGSDPAVSFGMLAHADDINISGGCVYVTAGNSDNSYGISSSEDVTISGGYVEIATASNRYGGVFYNNSLSITVLPQKVSEDGSTYVDYTGLEQEPIRNWPYAKIGTPSVASKGRGHKSTQGLVFPFTAAANEGGSITDAGVKNFRAGSINQTYTITANEGYYINTVKIDGVYVAHPGGGTQAWRFDAIYAPRSIEVTFKQSAVAPLTPKNR